MGILKLLFFFIQLISITVSQPDFFAKKSCPNDRNYTNDSIFKQNLDKVLTSISSDTQINNGYYNFSQGEEPDRVNIIGLCRATELAECRSCINNSTKRILQVCPNQKEAMGWYAACQIRYSDNTIFGVLDSTVQSRLCNTGKASDVNGFNKALVSLLDELREKAKSGDSITKFGSGDAPTPDPDPRNRKIYAFVECNPDLSSLDCDMCLNQLVGDILRACNASIGTRIVAPTCQLSYEIHPFFNTLGLPPPPPPPPPPQEIEKIRITAVIIIVVSTISAAIFVMALCIIWRMKKRRQKESLETVEYEMSSVETLQYDFNTIKLATNEFSKENKLGQGGFGAVYIGKLYNGQNIAVKRLAKDSQQGDAEFRNEVLLMTKLRHRNLVSLLGFCLEKNERLLIYEYVPNGSLDHILFDPSKRTLLDWTRRHKIIVGIARGLLYLHEDSQLRIIHRDLKASNILIDTEMNPKIADFGMARLFEFDETRGETSRIVGTYGYMAPEYIMQGRFSTKSDVFSFGILVLEILTGQKIQQFHDGENIPVDLLSFAWNKWREGNGLDIIDSTLGSESRSEMMKWIHIGLLCVQENIEARPTIASVIVMINSNSVSLPLPSKPAFIMHSTVDVDQSNHSYFANTTSQHSNKYSDIEASITDLNPR